MCSEAYPAALHVAESRGHPFNAPGPPEKRCTGRSSRALCSSLPGGGTCPHSSWAWPCSGAETVAPSVGLDFQPIPHAQRVVDPRRSTPARPLKRVREGVPQPCPGGRVRQTPAVKSETRWACCPALQPRKASGEPASAYCGVPKGGCRPGASTWPTQPTTVAPASPKHPLLTQYLVYL